MRLRKLGYRLSVPAVVLSLPLPWMGVQSMMVLYGGGCRSDSVDYSEHSMGVSIISGSEFCRRHGVYEWKRVTLLSFSLFFRGIGTV